MSRALLNRMLKEAQLDMAEFLNTSAITHHLNEIIRGARGERLLLISPYLKFSRQIKELLEEQARNWKTPIYVVYGKTELRSEETQWLAENDVRTFFREPLHAKCYMNESHALITSMNLYEFSQQNNDEMGILVSAEDDEDLYKAIKAEADHILRLSDNVRIDVPPLSTALFPLRSYSQSRDSACATARDTLRPEASILRQVLQQLQEVAQIQEKRLQGEVLPRLW